MRAGYACICLGRPELRSQRTTVLRNVTPARLRELICANIEGLEAILRYNEERDLRLFRIGNEFIPFASHLANTLEWWEEFRRHLRLVGRWVQEHGHRLSFHASHYTILNSLHEPVVESAIRDLVYHGRVLDAMGLPPEHKIILHAGASKPSFAEAEARFERALARVPAEVRCRLVLENDERFYPIDRVMALAGRVGLPVVFDVLHHACLPGAWEEMGCAEILERVFAPWGPEDGPPKLHFSTQDPEKKRGAHAYWIDGAELEKFLEQSAGVSRDFDLMFEAKGKDLAAAEVLPLLRHDPRFGLEPVARLRAA